MKIQNLLTDEVFDAALSFNHAACSYRQAVVIADGDAIDPIGLAIVEITEEEREQLPPWWKAVIADDAEAASAA